jgi:hypothetical protein
MKTITRILPAMLLCTSIAFGQNSELSDEPVVPPGGLSETSLGEALQTIGLKPLKTDKRYDFAFKTSVRGEEWKFSMSAVLSRNSQTVWVMAWLDEIPTKSTEVPRTALLKLLAANDRLGNGKFFAYIPTNKRFVLQRVLPNEQLNSKKLMEALQDLALSVADEYPTWAVAKWVPQADGSQLRIAGSLPPDSNANQQKTTANQSVGTKTSEAASKFSDRRIQ